MGQYNSDQWSSGVTKGILQSGKTLTKTFNGRAVESHQQLPTQVVSLEDPEEMQPLLCFLYNVRGVYSPGEIVGYLDPQEFESVDNFHTDPIEDDRRLICPALSKVQYRCFSFVWV